ncbi:MAG: hypothetical protein K0S65_4421 [Labilithrix sp.]|nr:hypothetical protein [Labilithrix sp.]
MTSTRIVASPLAAAVKVAIADGALAAAMTEAIAAALREAVSKEPAPLPIVRLRTRKRLTRLRPAALAGALVIVRVTSTNARRLPELVDAVRSAGPAGVQITWDGVVPPRAEVERYVFATLEAARATPTGPPVVLAEDSAPALALRLLIVHRGRGQDHDVRGGEGRS